LGNFWVIGGGIAGFVSGRRVGAGTRRLYFQ
jgi:hypothetical protein